MPLCFFALSTRKYFRTYSPSRPNRCVTTKRREVSGADSWQCSKRPLVGAFYSITSSARASTDGGTVGGLSEPIFVAASERGLVRGCLGVSQSESRTNASCLRELSALSVARDPGA